jgi:eukaryotic-like serine/threonine-protein kinase
MPDSHVSEPDDEEEETSLRGALEDIKIIATGGMSQIFRARQPGLDRYIAVKKLKEELLGNGEARERFRREARALASVLHQNIAHVYDFVEGTRESYILMEFIDGIDLSTAIAKVGHLPGDIAAAILLGVAKGVGYIHTHRLIHRDIKPHNIRLNTRGEVKLMDFGIVVDTENESLTRPGMMVGSPSYLSPEQVLGDAITPKADIFLLGICLYEMVTGTKPFREQGGETVFQRIREARYIPVKDAQHGVPAALERIVERCLEKDPGQRYDSVKNLILDLEEFLGHHASAHCESHILKFLDDEALLTPSIPHFDPVEHTAQFRRRKRMMWAGAAIVGIGLAFWGGYRLGRDAGQKDSVEVRTKFAPPRPLK